MTRQSRGAAFDPIFRFACLGAATMLLAALAGVVVSLAIGGWPAFAKFGFAFFTSTDWNPVTEVYGAAGPIANNIGPERAEAIRVQMGLEAGDACFFAAGDPEKFAKFAGAARIKAGRQLVFLEARLWGADGKLAVHATATAAVPMPALDTTPTPDPSSGHPGDCP